MISRDIITLLDEEVARNNTREFIVDDPVQFPRRYDDVRDIEIVSLLVAAISWGRRPMILRDADRMLALMDHQPYRYMMEEGYEDLPSRHNIHRTFFASDLQWYLRGLREIYRRYGTLDDFALAHGVGEDPMPAWRLVEEMQRVVSGVNGGTNSPQCLPTNLRTTALKRVNMALRWMVRDDGVVDMGIWRSIDKSRLYIPLDVHVGNTARNLGLIERKANDRKSVELLTAAMRELRPDDPAVYDFALFGIGVTGKELGIKN